MITRLDHVVIGVRDLNEAMQHYRQLGFEVQLGGRHTNLGTCNALIRFGLDYLELLAVDDEAEARGSGGPGQFLIEYLRGRQTALLGFALASDCLEDELAFGTCQPFAMQRTRPDGHVLSWRLLMRGEHTWRQPWPFLIQWDTPDELRLAWDGISQHSNGARGIAGLRVAARDVSAVLELYARQLGLPLNSSHVALANCPIEVVQADADDEGLTQVQIGVDHVTARREWFAQGGMSLDEPTLGAGLVFVA